MKTYEQVLEGMGYKDFQRLFPASCAVYKAKKSGSWRSVKLPSSSTMINSIRREANTLSSLQGMRNITHMVDYHHSLPFDIILDEEDRRAWGEDKVENPTMLEKEYVEGTLWGDLTLSKRKLLLARVKEIVRELHGRGFANLDLAEPTNILVTEDDEPYIIDLGSAVHVSSFEYNPGSFDIMADIDLNDLRRDRMWVE